MNRKIKFLLSSIVLLIFVPLVYAGNVTIPNNFTSGTPAVAAQVNANFSAVETAVDDNDGRITVNVSDITALQSAVTAMQANITSLQSTVSTLQTDLNEAENIIVELQIGLVTTISDVGALQTAMTGKADVGHNHDASYSALSHNHDGTYAPVSHSHAQGDITGLTGALGALGSQINAINSSEIMALDPYVTVANDSRGPIATFSGLNLQLVNGTGTTGGAPNGLGNFIIGYDVARDGGAYFCSCGQYTDQTACETNGYIWVVSHKTGSHYLVIGDGNNYAQFGGLVAGLYNTSNGIYASVSGGYSNTASGYFAAVSGGDYNIASGYAASVSGGTTNSASGTRSSISGGDYNIASGIRASVSGGNRNTASGARASVSGGGDGTVSGGNIASHDFSSILGGVGQTTTSVGQTIPALP